MNRTLLVALSLGILSLGSCSQSSSLGSDPATAKYTPEQLAKIQRLEALHARLELEIFGMPNAEARNQYLLNMDEAKVTQVFEIAFGRDTPATAEELRSLGVNINPNNQHK